MLHLEQETHLTRIARASMPRWGISPEAQLKMISLSENGMFLVDDRGERRVLRVHRSGYHTVAGVRSELAWMRALQTDMGLETPQAIPGQDGEFVQYATAADSDDVRMVVLFEFIAGEEPKPEQLVTAFPELGATSAIMHRHARRWQRPPWFERQVWDYEGALGSRPNWGPWRAGFAVRQPGIETLQRADLAMRQRLEAFGKSPSRFGLIHSDLRLANLLVYQGRTKVIDFDDCGFGWYLYDLASSVTFLETHPDIDDYVAAWIDGYRSVENLSEEELGAIPSFMMLRRLVAMGWAGSHPDTELAQSMGDSYTVDTVVFADRYLSGLTR